MRNRIDIDHVHSRAICREIGERLQAYLEPEPELPAHLRKQVNRFCELEGQSPSIVPDVEHRLGNEPGSAGAVAAGVYLPRPFREFMGTGRRSGFWSRG